MKQDTQILPAFLIPFSMAVGLLILRVNVFYDSCDSWVQGGAISFGVYDCAPSIESQIIGLFVVALFILSVVLPSYMMIKSEHQDRENKPGSTLNIE